MGNLDGPAPPAAQMARQMAERAFTEHGDGQWHEVRYTPEQEAEALARADAAMAEAEYWRDQQARADELDRNLRAIGGLLLSPIRRLHAWLTRRRA